jgi:hypothetical protein
MAKSNRGRETQAKGDLREKERETDAGVFGRLGKKHQSTCSPVQYCSMFGRLRLFRFSASDK